MPSERQLDRWFRALLRLTSVDLTTLPVPVGPNVSRPLLSPEEAESVDQAFAWVKRAKRAGLEGGLPARVNL
jgi:hypothetical protein